MPQNRHLPVSGGRSTAATGTPSGTCWQQPSQSTTPSCLAENRLDATQHVIANVQASVNDDGTVHATANVVATHVRAGTAGSPIWTVGGWYDAQLSPSDDGYAISSLTLHSTWQTGNFAIMTAD